MDDVQTVTIFRSWVELAAILDTDEERGKFYHAVCEYSLYGKIPELDSKLNAFFTIMRPSIDKSNKRKIAQQNANKSAKRFAKRFAEYRRTATAAKVNTSQKEKSGQIVFRNAAGSSAMQ